MSLETPLFDRAGTALVALLLGLALAPAAAHAEGSAASAVAGTAAKVEGALKRGASAAASGVERGAKAAGKAVEKGARKLGLPADKASDAAKDGGSETADTAEAPSGGAPAGKASATTH